MSLALILCGVLLLGYWRLTVDQQARTIRELESIKDQLESSLAARQAMVDRLTRSRRIAHVWITDQRMTDRDGVIDSDVLFVELDDQGSELARQEFTIPGDVLFIDAWTIKFDHHRVAEGDPLLGRTLILLRRIYSDRLAPKDGLAIDTPGAIPPGYAASDSGRFEKRLWENFWDLAGDSEKSSQLGIRVMQGEAVYKPVRAGQAFELNVDANGGMSLNTLPDQQHSDTLSRAER
jgi:hypothetical protein